MISTQSFILFVLIGQIRNYAVTFESTGIFQTHLLEDFLLAIGVIKGILQTVLYMLHELFLMIKILDVHLAEILKPNTC